ncbi:diguanylate cyclase domain-containing protein [Aureimonas sp. AU40]|uniref:diguanylate cyclase domain-containing protein n=1 Tax=Aureimonas sp. AU40 TaxID=1637747 RepID=UPI0007855904|nr:diguanylate cyclase [Aureimonas sp. AU40]
MLSAYESHRRALTRATAPVAVLVACLLAALLAGIVLVAGQQTRQADETNSRRVAEALKAEKIHLAQNTVDYATWEDVGQRVVKAGDKAWAEANLGLTLLKTFGIDLAFVIQPNGRTAYAFRDGFLTELPAEAIMGEGWSPLLDAARRAPVGQPVLGFLLADRKLAIAAASPLVLAEPGGDGPPPILVFAHRLQPRLLGELSHTYSLSNLEATASRPEGDSHLALKTIDNRTLGFITWHASSIGDDLLRVTLPIWFVLAVACTVTVILVRHQTDTAARLISIGDWRVRHDPLTELPNRILLLEHLDGLARDLIDTGRGFAVLYLDLDGFKAVNDTQGHDAGDQVLRFVAERIAALIGAEDLAVRLGGDEFCVVLGSGAGPARVQPMAEKLIQAIGEPMLLRNGAEVLVGATIGVVIAPVDGSSPRQLLHRADDALYHGKRIGKGRICFHRDLPLEGDRGGRAFLPMPELGRPSPGESAF